jgi:hypothetical protein
MADLAISARPALADRPSLRLDTGAAVAPATDPVVLARDARASDTRDGVRTTGRDTIRPRTGSGPATGVEVTPGPGMPGYPAPPARGARDGSAAHGTVAATFGDHLTESTFYRVADGADTIGLNNAARHMRHYLGNSGQMLWVDPAQMAADMPRNAALMDAAFQRDVVAVAQATVAANWSGQPMTFQITTPWRSDTYATRSDSQDWFFAVGGFSYAHTAAVTVRPDSNGRPVISIEANRHIFDRYNWDEGKAVTIAGITVNDRQLGRLHEAGLAQEYEVRGTTRLDPVTIRP